MFSKLPLRLVGLTSVLAFISVAPALATTLSYNGNTILVGGTAGGLPFGTPIDVTALPSGNTGGTVNGISFSFTPDAQAVTGSVVNQYAAPWLSPTEETALGVPVVNPSGAPDPSQYLTSGAEVGSHPGAAVNMSFGTAASDFQQSLGLIWGSVDLYNTISLYSGSTLVGQITGGDITSTANGSQGANGTYGVDIFSMTAFNSVVFTSSQYAFEFTGLTYRPGSHNPPPDLPEPGSLALFGAGLGLLGLVQFATRRGKADTLPRLMA